MTVSGSGRSSRRTPLGYWVWALVHNKVSPQRFLDFLRRDSGDAHATEALIRALVEAATERDAETAALATSAIRELTSPTSREVLATFAMVLEASRNGMANSKSLWHGHKHSGHAGGIGGRLRGRAAATVARRLDMLCASGALKRWQAKQHTAGVVRSAEGQCYQSYYVRHVPRAVVRAVRKHHAELGHRTASVPEAVPRPSPAMPRGAAAALPVRREPPPPPSDPPPNGAPSNKFLALVPTHLLA